jgi:predicted dehydrogenase
MDGKATREFSRRRFLKQTAAGASALALPAVVGPGVLGKDDDVKIAVVGCGGRGSRDLRALVAAPGVRVVGVCELKPDRLNLARQIASVFNPNTYQDYREMIEKEKPDGVTVVVEVQNHAKVVVPVLEMGFNCFSEKPLDTTVEKVDQIVSTARRTKKWVQFGFQRRYHPGHRPIVERIHKEELGPVYALQGHWHFADHQGPEDADWDGGRLIEQACHHMDAMSWVMKSQPPLRCVSVGRPPMHLGQTAIKHLSEAGSATVFEFPGNVIFSYTHFMGTPGSVGEDEGPSGKPEEQNFINEKLWVFCEKGGYDLTRGMKYITRGPKERVGKASQGYDEGTQEEFNSFVEHIRSGQLPDSNHETARVSTLMSMMGRMAMYDRESRSFTPRVISWKDLGSKTDPTA